MSGVLVEAYDAVGGVLVNTYPVLDPVVTEVLVAPPVGVVEVLVRGLPGPPGDTRLHISDTPPDDLTMVWINTS